MYHPARVEHVRVGRSNMNLRRIITGAVAALAAVSLVGCAPGAEGDASGKVTLRLWDENAAKAYESSIAEFEKQNPGIDVEINVVPWDSYFTSLRNEVGSGQGDDVFWLNGANVTDYVQSDSLINISETFDKDTISKWDQSVVDQYTQDGSLWGVPQINDGGSAYYVNEDLLKEAGVTADELSKATWSPKESEDTLLPILQKLTIDKNGNNAASPEFDAANVKTYAINASSELQNIQLNFIASNGGTYQDETGKLTFTNEKTVEAYQYIVDLINKYHVAPPAEATNDNGDYTRDEFLKGNIAVFQSGTYNLANVNEGAQFKWSVTEMAAGPEGKVTVAPGLIAAGNKNSDNPEATKKLLEWLGSAEGVSYLGEAGAAAPASEEGRKAYDEYWKSQDVDTSAFYSVIEGTEPAPPVIGTNYAAQMEAFTPALNEVFLGKTPVKEGLEKAQQAADSVG